MVLFNTSCTHYTCHVAQLRYIKNILLIKNKKKLKNNFFFQERWPATTNCWGGLPLTGWGVVVPLLMRWLGALDSVPWPNCFQQGEGGRGRCVCRCQIGRCPWCQAQDSWGRREGWSGRSWPHCSIHWHAPAGDHCFPGTAHWVNPVLCVHHLSELNPDLVHKLPSPNVKGLLHFQCESVKGVCWELKSKENLRI